MKLLIVGASGLLGINLALEAMGEHEVIGVDRGKLKSAPFRVMQSDFLQSNEIYYLLDLIRPDALVNCAALANLEECEDDPDQAYQLNAEFPAVAARNLGLDSVPLLCASEIDVPGAMPSVIRALVHYYAPSDHSPAHTYRGEAQELRSDLKAAQ